MIWLFSFILLIALLMLAIPVALVMGNLGFTIGWLFSPIPLYRAVGEISWSASSSFILFFIYSFRADTSEMQSSRENI